MFRFGKQVESALLALKALDGQAESGLSISEICSKHGLSRNTLAKIMQNLQFARILDSSQGTKGGYSLQRKLEEISFYEVLEALGEIKKLNCSENQNCTLVENCSISSPLQNWERQFEEHLKSTSLDQLLNDQHSNNKIEKQNRSETICL